MVGNEKAEISEKHGKTVLRFTSSDGLEEISQIESEKEQFAHLLRTFASQYYSNEMESGFFSDSRIEGAGHYERTVKRQGNKATIMHMQVDLLSASGKELYDTLRSNITDMTSVRGLALTTCLKNVPESSSVLPKLDQPKFYEPVLTALLLGKSISEIEQQYGINEDKSEGMPIRYDPRDAASLFIYNPTNERVEEAANVFQEFSNFVTAHKEELGDITNLVIGANDARKRLDYSNGGQAKVFLGSKVTEFLRQAESLLTQLHSPDFSKLEDKLLTTTRAGRYGNRIYF